MPQQTYNPNNPAHSEPVIQATLAAWRRDQSAIPAIKAECDRLNIEFCHGMTAQIFSIAVERKEANNVRATT